VPDVVRESSVARRRFLPARIPGHGTCFTAEIVRFSPQP
jgi:hypothetical protein